MEAGCRQSVDQPLFGGAGRRVLRQPAQVALIYQSERKSDQWDAQMLARIGRV